MQESDLSSLMAMTMGVGWASGINLYAAVLSLGIAGSYGVIDLPDSLAIIQDPLVIAAALFMYCVEFFADKIPGVDSAWDTVHTFIRIPAGALLASGMIGDQSAGLEIATGLIGGGLAASNHFFKMSTRLALNTIPEPFTNWTASVGEDAIAFSGMYLMMTHPNLFIVLMSILTTLAIFFTYKMYKFVRRKLSVLQD